MVVGKLTTTDPDQGDTHTYTVSDTRFEVVNGELKLKAGAVLNFDQEKNIDLTVTTTDKGGKSYQEDFTLSVQDDSNYPASPVNHPPSGAVSINGIAEVGKTLTASHTLQDDDGLGAITYRWYADGTEVASGASYTLQSTDKGKQITVKAEYTDGKGYAESVASQATDAVSEYVLPVVGLSGNDSVVEGDAAQYTVTLDKPTDRAVTLTLVLEHKNSSDADIQTINKTLTLPAGKSSATFTVQTIDDAITENPESYTVRIADVQEATLGQDIAVNTVISDNDHSPDNHQGSVNDSIFAGDRSTEIYPFIEAIDGGNQQFGHLHNYQPGQGLNITYHFSDDTVDSITGNTLTGVRAFSAQQKDDIRDVLDHVSRYVNVRFNEGNNATLNFHLDDLGEPEDSPVVGYAIYGSDVHLNSNAYAADDAFRTDKNHYINNQNQLKLYTGWSTVLHELGHSLGLDHPFGNPDFNLSKAEDRDTLTIMSYTHGEFIDRVDVAGSYYSNVPVSQHKLGIYDLIALHYRYGVNPQYNSGDDIYTFKSFNKDVLGNEIYIFDGGGQDMLDASDQTLNLTIDLTPGSWIHAGEKSEHLVLSDDLSTTTGQMFIGFGTQIESVKGGSGNDNLTGNSADNYLFGYDGDDTLIGGKGDDQLEGGLGTDTLSGGDGSDTFIFASPFDGTQDQILDFNLGESDVLQLENNLFTALDEGKLGAEHFILGREAKDGDDYILYDQATGELAYVQDGSGSSAVVIFAHLNPGDELTHQQIMIV